MLSKRSGINVQWINLCWKKWHWRFFILYLNDWSPTDWQPRNDRYFKKPPHLCEIFSMTGPYNSREVVSWSIINWRNVQCIPRCLVENRINRFSANSIHPMPKCSSIGWPTVHQWNCTSACRDSEPKQKHTKNECCLPVRSGTMKSHLKMRIFATKFRVANPS